MQPSIAGQKICDIVKAALRAISILQNASKGLHQTFVLKIEPEAQVPEFSKLDSVGSNKLPELL